MHSGGMCRLRCHCNPGEACHRDVLADFAQKVVVSEPAGVETGAPAVFFEIFCGHAGVAAACARNGFAVRAYDRQGNRHKPSVPCVQLDLTLDEHAKILFGELASKRAALV